jgi:hypothetical protein
MNLRSALLAAAALAASGIGLALGRWGAGGNATLSALAGALQQAEELAPHIEAARRRDDAKRALAAEVVAGRMTLREAAGRFRRLDEANPGFFAHALGPPRDERFFCENVLSVAWVVLMDQQRYAAAARWFAEAFTAHPHLLAGRPTGLCYNAACVAFRAGCGRGRDAADLDEATRAGFRRQALDWLRAELEAQRQLLEEEPQTARLAVARDLLYWLEDPRFAGLRGPEALARLPAPERRGWQQLWEEVEALRTQASGPVSAPTQPEKGDPTRRERPSVAPPPKLRAGHGSSPPTKKIAPASAVRAAEAATCD